MLFGTFVVLNCFFFLVCLHGWFILSKFLSLSRFESFKEVYMTCKVLSDQMRSFYSRQSFSGTHLATMIFSTRDRVMAYNNSVFSPALDCGLSFRFLRVFFFTFHRLEDRSLAAIRWCYPAVQGEISMRVRVQRFCYSSVD